MKRLAYLSACALVVSSAALPLIAPVSAQAQTQPAAAFCYNFTDDMGLGDPLLPADATALQQALTLQGFWPSGTPLTSYDDTVAAAVTSFQQKYTANILVPNGLSAGTGFAGPSTRGELNALYGCSMPLGYNPGGLMIPAGTVISSSYAASVQCPIGYTCTPINPVSIPVACPIGYTCTPISMVSPAHPIMPILPTLPAAPLAPTITSVNGPTTLAIGQLGTWSIMVTDPQPGNITYSIQWGDSSAAPLTTISGSSQTATFTHDYGAAGTYTITINATASNGYSAKTTSMVNVISSVAPVATPLTSLTSTTAGGASVGVGAPSYQGTSQTNFSGNVAVTWPFTFTVSAGSSPIYISATPSSAVTVNTSGPMGTATSITAGSYLAGDTNSGFGTSATGSFVVPSDSSRTFTVDAKLDNAGAASNASNAIIAISGFYYSATPTPSGSMTSTANESLFTSNLSTLQSPGVSLLNM